MQLHELTVCELACLLRNKEVSAEEITRAYLKRIKEVEDDIKAFVTLTDDFALEKARLVDEKIKPGNGTGPLEGIPVAVKDNICTRGVLTSCSSRILEGFVPPYNATVIKRLYDAGAVMVGKTNMDEFAMGSSTENSGLFPTRNPWDIERVPGGSSGGSAAAVAACQVPYALGSDTGGSIRQPASFCGVVGIKPTYGAVSRYGLIAFASSFDQIGCFTRCVEDCAIVLNTICGHDPMDSTSAPVDFPDFTSCLANDVQGMRIGLPREYFAEGISLGVKDAVDGAVKVFEEQGALVEETSLPHTEYALPAYYLIAPAEASSNLARYDGVRYGLRVDNGGDVMDMFAKTRREGFGPEVKRRIMLGTYALSAGYYDAYYLKALKVRTLIKEDFDRAFEKFDILLSPTTPTVAFKFGEKTDDPLQMYLSDVYTAPINLAGIPAISIPCGFVDGMPVGLQLIGKPFSESTLLRAAYAFEQATDYHNKRPQIKTNACD